MFKHSEYTCTFTATLKGGIPLNAVTCFIPGSTTVAEIKEYSHKFARVYLSLVDAAAIPDDWVTYSFRINRR